MCSDSRSENGDISEASIWKDSCRSGTWKCRIFLGKIARSRRISNACDICGLLFGVYGIVMTVLKDALILELGRQLAGKLRRK